MPVLPPDVLSLNGMYAEMRKTLSENWDTLSSNLTENNYTILEGEKYSFLIRYPKAIGYYGRKIGSDSFGNDSFKLFYKDKEYGTISQSDIDKIKLSEVSYNVGLYNYNIVGESIEAKIKGSKGATVDITGKGTVPVKKSTYIKGLKLNTDNKELKKDLKKAIKNSGYLDKIKKGKNVYVSANGCKEGGTYGSEEDMYPFVIGIYPAYAISSSVRGIQDICYSLFSSISANMHTIGEVAGENYEGEDKNDIFYAENKYGEYYFKDITINGVVYTNKVYRMPKLIDSRLLHEFEIDKIKLKNGKFKSLKVGNTTLKPSKPNKPKGLRDGGEQVIITEKNVSEIPKKVYNKETGKWVIYPNVIVSYDVKDGENRLYLVTEADGNFFGTIYIDITN